MVTALFAPGAGLTKEVIGARLGAIGVETRPFFHPLSSVPAYAGLSGVAGCRSTNPVSYDISPRAINLPSALRLDERDVDFVAAAVRDIVDSV